MTTQRGGDNQEKKKYRLKGRKERFRNKARGRAIERERERKREREREREREERFTEIYRDLHGFTDIVMLRIGEEDMERKPEC